MPDDPTIVTPPVTADGASVSKTAEELAQEMISMRRQFDAGLASVNSSLKAVTETLAKATVQARQPPTSGWLTAWEVLNRFFVSGVFFILLGGAFLFAAYRSMGHIHGAFTFVLVVLGVAVLLFGTGTQGLGNFSHEQGNMRYRVALAGGAGVLAFATGLGMVHYADKMSKVFDIENKHFLVALAPKQNASADNRILEKYSLQAFVNDAPVASKLEANRFIAYVPYRDTDFADGTKKVRFRYQIVAKANDPPPADLSMAVEQEIYLPLVRCFLFDTQPGLDALVYDPSLATQDCSQKDSVVTLFDLRSQATDNSTISAAANRDLSTTPGAETTMNAPPPKVVAE